MIRSKLPNKEYRDNYDKIFRKKKSTAPRTPPKERGADR